MPVSPSLLDPVSIAMATMVDQTPPHTPPRLVSKKPSKHSPKSSGTIRTLRGFSLFHRSVSLPAAEPVDPAANLCMYCKSMGHWSNDCPLSCTLCAKHSKDGRGHTSSNCSPMCLACDGLGNIRRYKGDERATEMLAVEASVKALSIMALDAQDMIDGGAQSIEQEDFRAHLKRAIMFAKMAMQDLEKLGDMSGTKHADDDKGED